MSHIEGCVSCLLHGTQSQAADQRLLRLSFQGKEQLLNLLRMEMFPPRLHIETKIPDKCIQLRNLIRVRLLMGPVYKRQLLPEIIFRHRLIGKEHEIFNDVRGHISLIRVNIRRVAFFIENNL